MTVEPENICSDPNPDPSGLNVDHHDNSLHSGLMSSRACGALGSVTRVQCDRMDEKFDVCYLCPFVMISLFGKLCRQTRRRCSRGDAVSPEVKTLNSHQIMLLESDGAVLDQGSV